MFDAKHLAGTDLLVANLRSMKLRDARLEGAQLTAALFLSQPQLNSARGTKTTLLPPGLSAPPHWQQD